MSKLSTSPDDYEDADAYARAQAINAKHDPRAEFWAVGGDDFDDREPRVHTEYGVEPEPGWNAEGVTDDIATTIESIVAYRNGSRLITRTVTLGPWRYVTPEEIEAAQ